jgi:hypothetical protein
MHAAAKRQAPTPLDPPTHELAVSLLTLWNPLMVALQREAPALLCPLTGPSIAPAANLAAALLCSWRVHYNMLLCELLCCYMLF